MNARTVLLLLALALPRTRAATWESLSPVMSSEPVSLPAQASDTRKLPARAGVRLETATLPSGKMKLAGVEWNANPGNMVVVSRATPSTTVPIGKQAGALCFLQTFDPGQVVHDWRLECAVGKRKFNAMPPPPTVARYLVKYSDGEVLPIDVRFGEAVGDWYRVGDVADLPWAQATWQHDVDAASQRKVVWYAMTWPNPRPAKAIIAVEATTLSTPYRDCGTLLLLGLATAQTASAGKKCYVAPAPFGDDAGDGSFDHPWESVQKAFASLNAGDTLFIRGGFYPLTRSAMLKKSGTEAQWICILAYPGETPVLDGGGILNEQPRKGHYDHDTGLVHVDGGSFIRIQGLWVQNSPRCGIAAYGKSARRPPGGPPPPTRPTSHVEVLFNTIYRTFAMGIVIHDVDHVRANGNTIVKPNSNEMSFAPGAMTRMALAKNRNPQEGLDLTANSHYELAFNEIYGGDKEGIDCISTDNGSIHHNYIHDQSGNGIYLDSWSLHQHDIEVASNRIDAVVLAGINLGTEGGGAMSRISIHHNIVSGARLSGIVIGESTWQKGNKPNPIFRDFSVKNNTVFGNQTGLNITAYPYGYATNIVVADNIFLDNSRRPIALNLPDYRERGIVFQNNLTHPAPGPETATRNNDRFDREEKHIVNRPQLRSPEKGDFRPMPGAAELRLGLGAITSPQAMIPGLDSCGFILKHYPEAARFRPVRIPPSLLNTRSERFCANGFIGGRSVYGEDLRWVPTGETALGGMVWFIEDYRQTTGSTLVSLKSVRAPWLPAAVAGIPVERKADSIVFLHTYSPSRELARRPAGQPVTLFEYVIHYADGTETRMPVVWMKDIGPWTQKTAELSPLPNASVAWETDFVDTFNKTNPQPEKCCLYAMTWNNSKARVPITTIDMAGPKDNTGDWGTPSLLAITTGEPATSVEGHVP